MHPTFHFQAKLWVYPGKAAWYFVTVPAELSAAIREDFGHLAVGFKSLRVRVTIGQTSWDTSIFPDQKRGGYLLPIKQTVRRAEGLEAGQALDLQMGIRI